jgi:riboflavin kinase/FMN adenylyltransferase
MGSFDGVHAGHRVIIARLNNLASQVGGSSVLITFHPHPRKVLYPETTGKDLRLITTLEEKCRVLEQTGLDHLWILDFTKDFARITSKAFVEEYLVKMLHAHTIVVGFNHFFGHNKEGNFESLYRVREKYGFKVEEIPEQEIQHETVSSTKIRKALFEGHIQRANAYLEHHFIMRADLVLLPRESILFKRPCYRIGICDPNKLIPPAGFFAVSVHHANASLKALVRISPSGIFLFPLDQLDGLAGSKVYIHFQKHIDMGGADHIEHGIGRVEELIY